MEKYVKSILASLLIALLFCIFLIYFNFVVCIPVLLLIVLTVALIIYAVSKKRLVTTYPNREVFSFKKNSVDLLRSKGYKIREKDDGVYVEKGILTATTLYFVQNGQDVELYRTNTATGIAWVLFIVGFFTALIVTLVIGVISETNSKNFAEKTIAPMLNQSSCNYCNRVIPNDAKVCPYCGKRT